MIHTTLISTDALAANVNGDWAIIDCRYDLLNEPWGREQHGVAHIPGAVYASLSEDLAGPRTGSNGRHPLPSVEALAATFGRFGLTKAAQVIVYDQDSGSWASRLWWSLRYLGHDAVAVLDGGWAKWLREGRPSTAGEERRPATTFHAQPRPEMRAALEEVASRLHDPAMLLVDARAPERFEGRTEPIDRAAGHIPGAANHFFKSSLADDGTMRPAGELKDTFTRLLNGRDASEAVMYCGSGITACHNLLAMEHAGLTGARLFVGSWSEWSSDPARPIATGK
jgi:thiosulfate/3-mercaptopyruvate sulfurtransferase